MSSVPPDAVGSSNTRAERQTPSEKKNNYVTIMPIKDTMIIKYNLTPKAYRKKFRPLQILTWIW